MSFRTKTPREDLLFTLPFANLLESGETINEPGSGEAYSDDLRVEPVTHPVQLTVGEPELSGTDLQMQISGGLAGTIYRIAQTVATSLGNTREAIGYVKVTDL